MLIKRFPQSEKFLFHPLTPFSLERVDGYVKGMERSSSKAHGCITPDIRLPDHTNKSCIKHWPFSKSS